MYIYGLFIALCTTAHWGRVCEGGLNAADNDI